METWHRRAWRSRSFSTHSSRLACSIVTREGCYRNTLETEAYLDRRKPSYVGGDLDHLNSRAFPLWNRLTAALMTGVPQSVATGDSFYKSLYADQSALRDFAKGMTGGSLLAAKALAGSNSRGTKHRTMIDLGTAQGCLAGPYRTCSSTHHGWWVRSAGIATTLR